jgi:protein-S-isoprenylcysteine O-methyltransferase Ste14
MAAGSNELTMGKIIFAVVYILIFPILILFLSGDWFWVEGWIFDVWFLVMCFTVIVYLYRSDPALLTERYKKPGTANQKGWDRYFVYGLVVGFFAWIVIMPLDAKRFGWTSGFPVWLQAVGAILLLLSFFLFFRAYKDNTFLSPLVRIQKERKHKVVSTGVYGFVRHPMYLGAALLFLGTPLLLGSVFGLIVGFLMILLLAARIVGEEKMLVSELEGYSEYRKKVRYRLLPHVW